MKQTLLLFILTCKLLFAQFELEKEYAFEDDTIYSSTLFSQLESAPLFSIRPKKMTHRIKAKELIRLFKKQGITVTSKASVITFKRAFSFDMTSLHVRLSAYYEKYYPQIDITALHVRPKSYLEALPENFTVEIPPKNFHHHKGTFYLKTSNKRRLFFEYRLEATLPVLVAKRTIERKETLSPFNTKTQTLLFKSFKSAPLSQVDNASRWCAKIRLKEGRVLLERNIQSIPLVKRNQNVIAVIKNGALHVELSAIAKNDGALYDMITIEKSNGEQLKAQVIGSNRVEIK
ncbi:MAG: flagellar basal body P-ring formation chaperone FlgA [Campylobacterota bacterium]|nr:flagellar basal body P-ring formation chaperone FlgA [Campylobacterota bacterium]